MTSAVPDARSSRALRIEGIRGSDDGLNRTPLPKKIERPLTTQAIVSSDEEASLRPRIMISKNIEHLCESRDGRRSIAELPRGVEKTAFRKYNRKQLSGPAPFIDRLPGDAQELRNLARTEGSAVCRQQLTHRKSAPEPCLRKWVGRAGRHQSLD